MSTLRWRVTAGAVPVAAGPAESSRSMTVIRQVFPAIATALGALGLLGWAVGSTPLMRVVPGSAPIRFNSAVVIVLLGLSWYVPRRARLILSALALVVSALTLVEYSAGLDLGIDQLAVSDPTGAYPGRMSVFAAGGFALLAFASVLYVLGRYRWAQRCALLVLVAACVVILGYAYDVAPLYAVRSVSRVAVPTAISLLLFSLAMLAAVPYGGLSWIVDAQDAGAQLARRLMPLTVFGLPVLGFACVLGQRAGLFADRTTSALIVILCATAVGAFAWVGSRGLSAVDHRRARAIAELTELRIDLERQVSERANQLQRRHNEIAVLEDRQRIAADLHDIVIQRLFAAGMYLQSGVDGADAETRRRLDNAVEAMDTAIKDLRASIFELGGRVHHRIDMTTAISDICAESARVLGFEPDLLIDDPDDDAEAFREDVLAVVREALANVARHAEASAVDVVLRAGDGQLWLSITDDGKGITEQTRRSGTRNMALRARGFGGDCSWTKMQPRGTRVLWLVPLDQAASA